MVNVIQGDDTPSAEPGEPGRPEAASSLSRGLSLLELFTPDESEISIREMSRRTGMPKSTTHRLVGDLVQWGALERGRKGVRLGVRMFELGNLVPDQSRLRDLAVPFAQSLAEVTRLTSNVAMRQGSDIIYVEKISALDLRVPHSRVGGRLPITCTGLGKAILAFSSQEFIDAILSGQLVRLAPGSITDPEELRKQLTTIRRTRVAYDLEESQPGLFCVAAPIFTRNNRIIGAISVTGATSRSQAQSFANVVLASATTLSRALGAGAPGR
ncbi:IclR family transcriptional regulator [Microbacterium album]|uniref:IclR family transcriptional regulator n=1 Tax=Microbacterium album TaxID=2053191 RepID=A0A917IGT6_9MICO|nr:IclR family transcriptional regulator [Microbacterium album]GGH42438.1 IclR family transcriptional regulator [Microbacterium album]